MYSEICQASKMECFAKLGSGSQERSETLSSQAFEGFKFVAIVNASDIFGKFFDIKFFILENAIPQMLLSVIYQTRASFFWSTRYAQRNINTC